MESVLLIKLNSTSLKVTRVTNFASVPIGYFKHLLKISLSVTRFGDLLPFGLLLRYCLCLAFLMKSNIGALLSAEIGRLGTVIGVALCT